MIYTDYQNKQFNKGMRGYEVLEVDTYISDLLNYCQTLNNQINTLEKRVSSFEEQEQYLKATLVTAEKTAASIIENAKITAQNMQNHIEKKAIDLITSAENEANAYRHNVYKCFFGYEQELRLVMERFHSIASKHMENLEKEIVEEIKSTVSTMDSEFNNIPKLRLMSKNNNFEADSNIIHQYEIIKSL